MMSILHSSAPRWPLVVYFHHVSPVVDHYTSLTPDSFRRGVEVILESFAPTGFDEIACADGSFSVPDRPAVLFTFDDGYADLLDDAVAELDSRGVRAVFFVCTELVGRRSAEPRESYLSWPELADLAAAGHTIGSHGRTHRALTGLPEAEARREVTDSLADLRARLRIKYPAYAYPYGLVRPLPDRIDGFSGPLTAFGTVKSDPDDWAAAPRAIRRVYLPADDEAAWPGLVGQWRRNWEGHQ